MDRGRVEVENGESARWQVEETDGERDLVDESQQVPGYSVESGYGDAVRGHGAMTN